MLGIYLPQAGRPEEERERVYETLGRLIRQYKGRGPLYILGDMSARVQRAEGRSEKEHIGKYTFEPHAPTRERSQMVRESMDKIINLCQTYKLRIMNTMFKKGGGGNRNLQRSRDTNMVAQRERALIWI